MYVAQDFYDPKNKDEAIFGKWSRIKAMFESAAKDPNDNQVSVTRTCLLGAGDKRGCGIFSLYSD